MPKYICAEEKKLKAVFEKFKKKPVSDSYWCSVKNQLKREGLVLNEANLFNFCVRQCVIFSNLSVSNNLNSDNILLEIQTFLSTCPEKGYEGKVVYVFCHQLILKYIGRTLAKQTMYRFFKKSNDLPRIKGDTFNSGIHFSFKGRYDRMDLEYFFVILCLSINAKTKQINPQEEYTLAG